MSGHFLQMAGKPRPRYLLPAGVLVCQSLLLAPPMAAADVSASIRRSAISLGETVQLMLESDDKSNAHPDLSVLAPDFEIVARHSSHNISIINGQRSEHRVLILGLRPQRSGELQIPPIRFGDRSTESLPLSVTPSAAASAEPIDTDLHFPAMEEAAPPATVVLESDLEPPRSYVGQQPALPLQTGAVARTPPTAPANQRDKTTTPSHLWISIAVAFALAWIATMAAWWRSKRRPRGITPTRAAAKPLSPVEEAPSPIKETEPLQREIEAVCAAYQSGDARAAREALLTWARQALPNQTPSNLARLAQRCPQPLRDQILLLEEAFFSPRPIAWNGQPVWEGLKGFVPAPPEEPASFRRGKPIRRRAANPEAE